MDWRPETDESVLAMLEDMLAGLEDRQMLHLTLNDNEEADAAENYLRARLVEAGLPYSIVRVTPDDLVCTDQSETTTLLLWQELAEYDV
jgi:hypothetical protein